MPNLNLKTNEIDLTTGERTMLDLMVKLCDALEPRGDENAKRASVELKAMAVAYAKRPKRAKSSKAADGEPKNPEAASK